MHVPVRTGPRAPESADLGARRVPGRDQPREAARLHHSDERGTGTPAPPTSHSAGTTTPPPNDGPDPSERRRGRAVQGGSGTTRSTRTGGRRDGQRERGVERRWTRTQRDRGEKTDVPTTAIAAPLATTPTSLPSLPATTPTSTATPRTLTATSRAPTATIRALTATTCIRTATPRTLTTDATNTTRGPAI